MWFIEQRKINGELVSKTAFEGKGRAAMQALLQHDIHKEGTQMSAVGRVLLRGEDGQVRDIHYLNSFKRH